MRVMGSIHPYYKKDIVKVESVQRKAARFCIQNYQQTASVTDMIKELGWDSLESRSKKARLNLMYKLAHRLINIDTVNHLESHSEMRTRGSHSFKYRIPKFYKDVFKFSFFPRTIKVWNSLSDTIVNSDSVEVFKVNRKSYTCPGNVLFLSI